MSKFTLAKQIASEVETPPSGQATMFLDVADDKFKVKLDDGSTKEVVYAGGGPPVDKNFVKAFAATDVIAVTHGLQKIPAVVVIDDTTGRPAQGEIEYDLTDINNKLTVRLSQALTGRVICN